MSKIYNIRDRIIVALFLVFFLVIMVFLFKGGSTYSKQDTNEGLAYLQQLDEQPLYVSQQAVDDVLQQIRQRNNADVSSFKDRFRNTAVLGDSLVEAFGEYDLLLSSNVFGVRGGRVDNCDDAIDKAIASSPRNVFFCYGMNDLDNVGGDPVAFTRTYKTQIQKVKDALPKAKIYVTALVPMSEAAYAINPYYKADKDFNAAIQQMCTELNATYVDTTLLSADGIDYEPDHVHPTASFYPRWLQLMADTADL